MKHPYIALSLALVLGSCEKPDAGRTPKENPAAQAKHTKKQRDTSPSFRSDPSDRQKILSSLKPLNEELLKKTDEEIRGMCVDLIKNEGLIPSSDASKNLVYALSALLSRNAELAYDLMNSLPPGYHSEDIVGQVFSRSDYTSLNDIMKVTSPLQDPDFFRIALERGSRSYLIRATNGEVPFDISPTQFQEMKAAGVTRQVIVDYLIEGVSSKNLPLSAIAENFSAGDNLLMKRVVERLPLDQAKTAIESVYNTGANIDKPTLKAFTSRLAVEDAATAMEWAGNLPGPDKITGIGTVTSSWMAAAPIEASKYVSNMTLGPEQDAAISSVVDNLFSHNQGDEALQWINAISDKKLREDKIATMKSSQGKGN